MTTLISLSIAKAHLRVGDSEHDDALIQMKLDAAVGIAGDFTNRNLEEEFCEVGLPGAILSAILLILGTLYDNESDEIVGRSVSKLSLTAEALLEPWRKTPY